MNPIVANSHFYSFERKKKPQKLWKSGEERRNGNQRVQTYLTITRYLYRNTLSFQIQCTLWLSTKTDLQCYQKSTYFPMRFLKKNISHKSFEKVEKRGKMEIKESSKLIWSYKILSCVQKYVDFSNPVYFMVPAKNRPAMLPEKQIFSWRYIFQEESFLYLSNLFLKFFKWQQLISFHGIFNYFLFL